MTASELAERGLRVKPLVFVSPILPPYYGWEAKAESALGDYYLDGDAWLAPGDDPLGPFRRGGIAAAEADHDTRIAAQVEVA